MASNFMRGCIRIMISVAVLAAITQNALGEEAGKLLGVPSTYYDLGTEVDRIAVDLETGDVYVAGNNILYHLDANLSFLESVILDHTKPCRCNNSVKVLEIEPTFRRLLVCATSKKGECVLTDLKNITKISILRVGTTQEHGFLGSRIVVDESEEPIVHFVGQNSFASRLVVASPNSVEASEASPRSKPLVSLREIQSKGGTFYMNYVTLYGGQLQMNKFHTDFQYYAIDSFCHNDMCYLITLQEAKARSNALVNRLVTVCTGTLYPYVESPLGLKKDNRDIVDISRVVAAALGKVGTGSGNETPVVVIIFGLASNVTSRYADVSKGYTIAVVQLSEVQNHIGASIGSCSYGQLSSPDWITGAGSTCATSPIQENKCNQTEKMTVRQTQGVTLDGESIPVGDGTGTVVSVFTHTGVVGETMMIFVVLSSGRVHILQCAQWKISYVRSTMQLDLPVGDGPPHFKHDLAVTSEFYYSLTGTKVVKMPLDYCREISTCEVCGLEKDCGWCTTSQKCQLSNKNCSAESCPPVIKNVSSLHFMNNEIRDTNQANVSLSTQIFVTC